MAFAIAFEFFKPIAGQRRQDIQGFGIIEHLQLAAGIGPQRRRELADRSRRPVIKQILRERVAECSNHCPMLLELYNIVHDQQV